MPLGDRLRSLWGRLTGSPLSEDLEPYRRRLAEVAALEARLAALADDELAGEARRCLAELGSEEVAARVARAAPLFALVREAGRRLLGERLFDEQVVAGLALAEGRVAELQTGEGKTLAAVAPAILLAAGGAGVHVWTFNDYLAERDARWMAPLYRLFGLRAAHVAHGLPAAARRDAYLAEVTYASAKEVGFDFLRDQLATAPAERVLRPLHAVLVDEADSLLVDEARIPLVLAGGDEELELGLERLLPAVRALRPGEHVEKDAEGRHAFLSDAGIARLEAELGLDLYAQENLRLLTAVNLLLHALFLLERDVDYIVRDGRIELVDDRTGRVAAQRRWPYGLQSALEVKEGVARRAEGRVLATITVQHLCRLYAHRAGMTGTARACAEELRASYGLCTLVVPPHRPCVRVDEPDLVFLTREEKERVLLEEVARSHRRGQPVLVGTASVAESERLAARFAEVGLPFRLLNAKHDAEEAALVAEAGLPGAITISTNMAGRGTDIRLGGAARTREAEVIASGGLYVLGTNRHESRRVYDQLCGRAGRQGDPGRSRFLISLEDPIFQQYGLSARLGTRTRQLEPRALCEDRETRAEIERTQRIVEGQHQDLRTTLLRYSELVEQQRVRYQAGREALLEPGAPLAWLERREPELAAQLRAGEDAATLERELRRLLLDRIDDAWADHLATVAEIREGIHLHSVGGGGFLTHSLEPIDAFSRMLEQAFAGLAERLERELDEELRLARERGGGQLARSPSRRPAATWTYLVSDDPFASLAQNVVHRIRRLLVGRSD